MKYGQIAAMVILVYDHGMLTHENPHVDLSESSSVLTLDQEVRRESSSIARSFLYYLKGQPDMETQIFWTLPSIRHKPIWKSVAVHGQCNR